MSGLPIVMMAIAVALSLGPQPPSQPKPTPPKPTPQPAPAKKPAVVEVQLVVGPREKLNALCATGTLVPTTILVTEKTVVNGKPTPNVVYHCVGKAFIPHADHGKNPALDNADVHLSAGDSVKWVKKEGLGFFVKGVTKPSADLKNANPASPFSKPFSTTYANEVTSTPVVNINGATVVVQRYKVTFNIEGQGDVDPDLVCSM